MNHGKSKLWGLVSGLWQAYLSPWYARRRELDKTKHSLVRFTILLWPRLVLTHFAPLPFHASASPQAFALRLGCVGTHAAEDLPSPQ